MKYLGWIVLLLALVAGIILYNTKYLALQNRLEQQARETEMWMGKVEQAKRQNELSQTRQEMAPNVSLLLADLFPATDSFNLSLLGRDTLTKLANELRRTKGTVLVTVYTGDDDASLNTRVRYADAWALAAAKAAVITRFLQSKGVAAERMLLQAFGGEQEKDATLPDLRTLSGRRLEIRVVTE